MKRQDLPASSGLRELRAWLDDDKQWDAAHTAASNWQSLLDDVGTALHVISQWLQGGSQEALVRHVQDLRTGRAALGKAHDRPDAAQRRRLSQICDGAFAVCRDPESTVAVFEALVTRPGKTFRELREGVTVLDDLLRLRERDARSLLREISGLFDGDEGALRREARVRGLAEPAHGMATSERLDWVRRALRDDERRVDSVVWLQYALARLGWPAMLQVGDAITLYDGTWLKEVLATGAPNAFDLPQELRGPTPHRTLMRWIEDERDGVADAEPIPYVFVRIEVKDEIRTRVVATARQAAETLVGFASLYVRNHSLWVLEDSYVATGLGAHFAVRRVNAVTFEFRTQDDDDRTAYTLRGEAELLGRRLPSCDGSLEEPARLLSWLRGAGATSGPARLVLCDRVIEQVAGWSGWANPTRFTDEALRASWVYMRMREELERGFWALQILPHADSHAAFDRVRALAERHSPAGSRGPSIALPVVFEHLDELRNAAPEGTEARDFLDHACGVLASKTATKRWIEDTNGRFTRELRRTRRTRNALMHGGPVAESTVVHAVMFAETVAHQALGATINAILLERDVCDEFLRREDEFRRCYERLESGVPAAEAMFWTREA